MNTPNTPGLLFAGVDEAGRGPLCGEVVAAAVVLDPANPIAGLADSKKLSEKRREALFPIIQERALAWCIATASVDEIDNLNILRATMLAMRRCVLGLADKGFDLGRIHCTYVDGNQTPDIPTPVEAIIKGDDKVQAISAASILAKVHRDRLCLQMHEAYPQYGIAVHKGYPTAGHMQALLTHGPSPIHRKSFGPVRQAGLRTGAL